MSKRSYEYISESRGFKENTYDRNSFFHQPPSKLSRWGPENSSSHSWLASHKNSVNYHQPSPVYASEFRGEEEPVIEERRPKNMHRERFYPANRLPTGQFRTVYPISNRTFGEDVRERREEEERNKLPPKMTVAQPGANPAIFKVLQPMRSGKGVGSDHVVIPLASFGSETGKSKSIEIHPSHILEDLRKDREVVDNEAELSKQMKQEILESFMWNKPGTASTNTVNFYQPTVQAIDSTVSEHSNDLNINSSSSSETINNALPAQTNSDSSSSVSSFQVKCEPVDEFFDNRNTIANANVVHSPSSGQISENCQNQSNNAVLQLIEHWNQMSHRLNQLAQEFMQFQNAFQQFTPAIYALLPQHQS